MSLLPITGAPWSSVRYGCTTRQGGVSAGPWEGLNLGLHVGDDPRAVAENRRRLAAGLPGEPFWLEQLHGTGVADGDAMPGPAGTEAPAVGASPAGGSAVPPCADAAVTTRPGRVLAILTADCIPVVIADTAGRALGVAHAGWRGLAAGVLESTFAALRVRCPDAAAWRAWIGPCIGQARFEVGSEVRAAFVDTDRAAASYFMPGGPQGKWLADLPSLARHRLEMMGIYNVEWSGMCTFDRADLFYSYRRAPVTGRMATLAWLEPHSTAPADGPLAAGCVPTYPD